MLKVVGVSQFDEQVYRALLRDPQTDPARLAATLGITSRRVVAALSRLIRMGLVRRADGRYAPNDPKPAFAALLNMREMELNSVRTTVTELAEEFRAGSLQAHPAQLVEVVTGREEIFRRTMELYQGTRHEVMAFERPPYAVPPTFDEVETERPILARGVTLRVIYSAEALQLREKLDIVRSLVALGEDARTLPQLPLKLVIVDGHTARVSLTSDAYATESVAIIHSSGLLDALIALFEAFWERAHPINGSDDVPPDLTPDEARVLAMLGAGFKDEAIARHLGISMRTTGRRVLSIMDQLQASTRFQAGAQAVRRGWL